MNRIGVIALLFVLSLFYGCNDCVCPDYYDPVCGSNNRTYDNPCQAECDDVEYITGECPVYGIGEIQYSGDTLCGYYVSVLGTRYKPETLPDGFKIHGQTVGIRYRRMSDYFTCVEPYGHHQVIEILELEKLK